MPTNKKKHSNRSNASSSKQTKGKDSATGAGTTSNNNAATTSGQNNQQQPPVKPFTSAQFATLILLSIGISRILQVRSSYAVGTDGSVSKTCQEYFTTDIVCSNEYIQTLLRLKFHSAIFCLLFAITVTLRCWNDDNMLTKVNGLFIFSPMMTGMTVLLFLLSSDNNNTTIPQSAIWKEGIICLVLTVIAVPTSWKLSSNRVSSKSLPNMILAGLSIYKLIESILYMILTIPSLLDKYENVILSGSNILTIKPMVYKALVLHHDESSIKDAAKIIVQFMSIDSLTVSLLCTFSWYALHDNAQRVALFFFALIHTMQYLYVWPNFEDNPLVPVSDLQTNALTATFLCGIARFAPF